jgi:hypothetical protein
MPDHPLLLIYGALAAIVATVAAAFATRVQLLPDVIDLLLVPTGSGVVSLMLVSYGAARQLDHDRIGRLALLGTLLGGVGTAAFILLALLADVLS